MAQKRTSLVQRFYLTVFLFFVIGALAWGFVAVSASVNKQRRGTNEFLAKSQKRVDEILAITADGQADLMDQAVRQLSSNLGREFEDIPFTVFEGRDDLLLAYLKERLEEGRRRNEDNSRVIASLFRQDSTQLGREKLASLTTEQGEESEALTNSLRRSLLLWGGAFLVGIGLLVGLVFHRGVAVPLRDATKVIESMGDGELSRRIPESQSDEINRLAKSFNTMADEINSQHANLEGTVAQKTEALSLALNDQQETNRALRSTLSELESTQAQLVESEKMAALGTMAKGMAHEFNNIIGGVAGLAEDLAHDVEDEDSKRVLGVIQKTSRRALVITENLLRFSRGSAHGRSLVDLCVILQESMSLIEPEASRRQVEVRFDGAPGSKIVTDGRGLQQVFLNLLVNALHAVEQGGLIHVSFEDTDSEQIIQVKDNGIGIPEKNVARIFEPFFSTKAQEDGPGGTGLGLAVARGIVEKISGSLTVSSHGPGRGSQFTVKVPKGGPRDET